MIDWISQSWPWYVSGPMITLVMFLMLFFGKKLGVSSNLETMCSIAGAGKVADLFKADWKSQSWNLVFIFGVLIGGYVAQNFLTISETVAISEATIADLRLLGIRNPGDGFIPTQFISWEGLGTVQGFVMVVVGGVLVGFGTRYGKGCTSGHAISGLSNLQLPSLIAVVGFFIGGLLMTHLILPYLLTF